MNKANICITLLLLLQITQVLTGGSGLGFNVKKASAYLNGGNCYVQPGYGCSSGSCNSKNIGVRYYNLPHGWKQYQDKLYIPNLLSQKGQWTFGAKASDGSDSTNQIFKISLNGLKIQLAQTAGSDSNNLVIGSNYRTNGVTEQEWKSFVTSLTSGQGYFDGNGAAVYWFSGRNNIGTGKRGTTIVRNGIDNLYGYDDDQVYRTIMIGTPSQTTKTTTAATQTDSKQKAINAQYAAGRTLDDINTLIAQLTTSISSGTASFDRLTQTLTTVKTTSSQCNDKIMQLSTTQTKSQTDIDALNTQIEQAKAKLNDFTPALSSLVSRRDELVNQRNDIQKAKSPKADELVSLQTKFTSCNSQVDGIKGQFTTVQTTVQANNDKINTLKANSADAPNQVQLATQQLSVVVASITQLQTKLNQAKAQKAKIQGDIQNQNNVIQTSTTQIQSLQSENSNLNTKVTQIQSRVDSKTVECSGFQTQSDSIRSQIASQQSSYDDLNKQIQVQQNLIADKKNQIGSFQAETKALPSKLTVLRNDLSNAKTALQRQYSICSQSTQAVTKADNQLKAVQLKLETQKKFLSQAQAKLSSAVAAKKAADDAVSKFINDINKYNTVSTISTGTTGTTGTTVSTGSSTSGTKNIRGGISGVVTTGSGSGSTFIYAAGPISIGNIGEYLSRVYGQNLKSGWAKFSGPKYSIMYPASKTTVGALYGQNKAGIFLPKGATYLTGVKSSQIGSASAPSNLIGDFGCSSGSSSASGVTSGYGKIISVQPGYITCSTNAGIVNLRIGGCSRLEANKPDYVYSVQDNIFWRGLPSGGSSKDIHAHDITCLS